MQDDEEFEEEGSEEESSQPQGNLYCPVCGSDEVRLIETRHKQGFYECESCHLTFEEN